MNNNKIVNKLDLEFGQEDDGCWLPFTSMIHYGKCEYVDFAEVSDNNDLKIHANRPKRFVKYLTSNGISANRLSKIIGVSTSTLTSWNKEKDACLDDEEVADMQDCIMDSIKSLNCSIKDVVRQNSNALSGNIEQDFNTLNNITDVLLSVLIAKLILDNQDAINILTGVSTTEPAGIPPNSKG